MELCSANLKDWLEKENNLTDVPISQKNIFRDLADALSYIHNLDIIHRDIKPANIMVNNIESNPMNIRVKLGDFGLSRTLKNTSDDLTRSIGTELYAAPEIENNNYDFRSDVYSLGLVIIELFCNRGNYRDFLISASTKENIPLIMTSRFTDIANIVKEMIYRNYEKRLKARKVYNLVMEKLFDMNDVLIENESIKKDNIEFQNKILELQKENDRLQRKIQDLLKENKH